MSNSSLIKKISLTTTVTCAILATTVSTAGAVLGSENGADTKSHSDSDRAGQQDQERQRQAQEKRGRMKKLRRQNNSVFLQEEAEAERLEKERLAEQKRQREIALQKEAEQERKRRQAEDEAASLARIVTAGEEAINSFDSATKKRTAEALQRIEHVAQTAEARLETIAELKLQAQRADAERLKREIEEQTAANEARLRAEANTLQQHAEQVQANIATQARRLRAAKKANNNRGIKNARQ